MRVMGVGSIAVSAKNAPLGVENDGILGNLCSRGTSRCFYCFAAGWQARFIQRGTTVARPYAHEEVGSIHGPEEC